MSYLFMIIQEGIRMLVPILISLLIGHLGGDTLSTHVLYSMAVCMCILILGNALTHQHISYHSRIVGVKIKTALGFLIYNKVIMESHINCKQNVK